MYNQGYNQMSPGTGGGYGDMGGMYRDVHGGQYPSSPSHMGGGANIPYGRNPAMHNGLPAGAPLPGGYGALPHQGAHTPMGFGRGGQPLMEHMQPSGMYGAPMMRHDGYPDTRVSPPAQVGYGAGAPVGPPPPPPMPAGPPYGGVLPGAGVGPGGPMNASRPPAGIGGGGGGGGNAGYLEMRARGMGPQVPASNASRPPRIGTPDPGMMPPNRMNQSPMMGQGLPPQVGNFMPLPGVSPSPHAMIPTTPSMGDTFPGDDANMSGSTEALYDFLHDRGLVSVDNISKFFPEGYGKDDPALKVAVDGNFCLTSLRDELRKRDSLWFLHSTLPEELLMLVQQHVEWMRNMKLEPIWVFNGLSVSGDVETFLTTEAELRARDAVWSKLEDGEIPDEVEIQEAFDQPLGEDVQMAVARYLKEELGVMAVTAPFLNWAQMVAFHKEGIADLLMGPPEMLLLPYDEMKVIVQIDVSNSSVNYLDRDRVLRALFPNHVTETNTRVAGDRLMDLGLITATHAALSSARVTLNLSMQEVYEELSTPTPKFRSIKDFINAHACSQETGKKAGLSIKHSKGRGYLRYSAVFSTKSRDTPLVYLVRVLDPDLTNADMPTNLAGVLGHLVPLSLFYMQFSGLLSVRIMTAITQSYLRDECPVSDTKDYHTTLGLLMTMRSQVIGQILKRIAHPPPIKRTECLSWVRWFQPILAPMDRPRDLIDLDEWEISDSDQLKKLDEDCLADYSIASVLSVTADASRPAVEESNRPAGRVPIRYNSKRETFLAILLKSFDFLGYFSHSTAPNDALDGMEMECCGMDGHDRGGSVPAAYHEKDLSSMKRSEASDINFMADEGLKDYPSVYFPIYLRATIKANPLDVQASFVLLTELVRVRIINSNPCRYINPANQQVEISMDDQDTNSDSRVLLASRIACLVKLPYRRASENLPFVWAPVYSRHLCAFTVMVRAMCRCLRELVEVITSTVFLSGNSSCSLQDFAEFASILPFGDVPSTIGGLLLHYVLVFPSDYQASLTTREERIEYLQGKFRDIPDLADHLHLVMSFTLQALYLINAYKLNDKETIVAKDQLTGTIVEDTIEMMWEKWRDHIDDNPPGDIHNLYPPQHQEPIPH